MLLDGPDETAWMPDSEGPCQLWPGALTKGGYGRKSFKGRVILAHRYEYAKAFGVIPDGLILHHKCGNPQCVRLDHLQAMTLAEHTEVHRHRPPRWQLEKTHCPSGHAYDEANTYVHNNKRFCRACHRRSARETGRRASAERKAA